MDDSRNERIAAAFDRLFRTYQQSDRGEAAELVRDRMERAAIYFDAVAPYEVSDVEAAVDNFLNGAAPGHNQSFAPPAPLVGAECRRVMNLRLDHERRMRPILPPPPEPEITPEERARGTAKLDALLTTLAKQQEPEDAEKLRRNRERAEHETKWLLERGDLVELKGHPFPVSRSLAKMLGIAVPKREEDAA